MNESNWLESLDEEQRERVFAAMRRIGELAGDIGMIMKKNSLPGDVVRGPAGFDEILKNYVMIHFVRCLGNGMTPPAAMESSWEHSRKHVAFHNRQYPRGVDGACWQGHGDTYIDHAFRLILDAVPELEIKWPFKDPKLSDLTTLVKSGK